MMFKLTNFSWQGFLGKLTPNTVARLGEVWGIEEWKAVPSGKKKQNRQDIKLWANALNGVPEERLAELVDYADQIKTAGRPEGRFELQFNCPVDWFEGHFNESDEELSAIAFLEKPEEFREALDWIQVKLADRWEYYRAESTKEIQLSGDEVSILEERIGEYWKERGLGGRCSITTLQRDSISVIDIGYEQEPEAIRQFSDMAGPDKTELSIIRPVRDALVRYDSSNGDLQFRMFRGNPNKYDDLVGIIGKVCFLDVGHFPTGSDRAARYNLSPFSQRPAFLKEIDTSSGLEKVVVTELVFEPPSVRGPRLISRIPSRQADISGRDAYDILVKLGQPTNWKVIRVGMKAHFTDGKRKKLPIELKEKGGASLSGDPRYEIIDDHLRRWGVLK